MGGKPINSLPAYLPLIFEAMVLVAGVGVFCAFLLRQRLCPGRREDSIHPRVTDDRFVIAVDAADAAFDDEPLRRIWQRFPLSLPNSLKLMRLMPDIWSAKPPILSSSARRKR